MNSSELAKLIRTKAVEMVYRARASHIGGALSIADILAVLYTDILNVNPNNPYLPDRDRLLLSKGHCCTSLYAVLALKGFFSIEELQSYGIDGSRLVSHATHHIPGIEISAGSLGHGLPIACGLSLAAKRKKQTYKTYCIVGDGEMDEGSNWEALLFAAQHQLDNLCLIIDYNKIQSLGNTNNVINLEPLKIKLDAFNWHTIEINGHNHGELNQVLNLLGTISKPLAIIAHTIKGKGVSFMENQLLWHYRSPNEEQYVTAINEIQQQ